MSSLRAPAAARRPAAARPDEYERFCEGIRRICGIDLGQYKRPQMERRIRTFAQRSGIASFDEYLTVLKRDRAALDEFLDRVTINVSQLWRNPDQWVVLRREVLPVHAATGRIHAWSAGCSYGAEAYTLAALMTEVAPKADLRVVGTDIDARVVERARKGFFSAEDGRDAPRSGLRAHFEERDGGWQAPARLKAITRFETGDLLRMRPAKAAYDLVLCRNTVIYFNEDVRDALHGRLAESLRPGGHLVIGSTERIAKPRELGLEPSRPFIYRKL